MKRYSVILTILLSATLVIPVKSQNYIDALRYSQDFYGSTARSAAMGSAFGALGGDFSSIGINPAGIGVYRSSEFTITPVYSANNVKSSYLGNSTKETNYDLSLGNLGFVLAFPTNKDNGLVSANISFGYNKQNYFNENFDMHGYNNQVSVADYFLQNASGNPANLDSYWERLAFATYVIDTAGGNYYTPVPLGEDQHMTITRTGSKGEYNFGFGANISNLLYLGASLNIQTNRFDEESNYIETNTQNASADFNSLNFRRNLSARANGVNFNIGAIVKPIQNLRLGVAFHSPTFYNVNEEFNSEMFSDFKNGNYYNAIPTDVNDQPIGTAHYEYTLITPPRLVGSVAYTLFNTILLSGDYEYVDYSTMKLRDGMDGYDYSAENQEINTAMRATNNIRAGVEFKLGTFYLRGGYGYYQSPYASAELNKNANTTIYSGGLGYRDNNFFIDFAYTYSQLKDNYVMFPTNNPAWPTSLNTSNSGRVMTTIGFRF